jgi:hypothetical protein
MSKRLQVIIDDAEFDEIQRIARRERMTVSEWVRQSLRRARRSTSSGGADRKLEAIRAAVRHRYPTADIEQLLAEIEKGGLAGSE